MKTIHTAPLGAVLILLAAAACTSPVLTPPESQNAAPQGGQGVIRVTLGNGARTVLPGTEGLYYALTFTPKDGGETVSAAISAGAAAEQSLKAGFWGLEVRGYISEAAYTADPADYGLRGTAEDVEVKAGETNPVSVALSATAEGVGVFVFDLSFPAGVTEAELSFVKLMRGDYDFDSDPDTINLLNSGLLTEGDFASQSRGRVSIPSGYYRVRAGLAITEYGKTRRLIKNVTVHIRDSLETTLSESYGFGNFKEYFTTIAALKDYLKGLDANTADIPYSVALDMPLSGLASGSGASQIALGGLFDTAYPADKFIDLDLSACTGTITGAGTVSASATTRKYLVSVILPDSVTGLPNYTFAYCTSVKSFEIPEGVASLGQNVFTMCTSLETVTLPATLQTFPTSYGLTKSAVSNLKSLILPASLEGVLPGNFVEDRADFTFTVTGDTGGAGYRVRDGGKTLVKVDGEGKITIAAMLGFAGTVVIDDTVKAIGPYVFYKDSPDTSITGLDLTGAAALETIGEGAFSNCTGITSLDLSGATSLTGIGRSAFQGCTGLAGTLTIPAGVSTIGESAFYRTGFTSLDLSGATSLTSIESYVFSGCNGLAGTLTIPAGIITIGTYAFSDSRGITSLDLSGATSLTSIGSSAFRGCTGLTSVTLSGTGTSSLASIGTSAFYGCVNLVWVKWPKSAVDASIGGGSSASGAFYGCTKLTKVELPDGLTSIGNYAFYGCSNLAFYVLRGETPPTLGGTSTFTGTSSPAYLIYVPDAKVIDYTTNNTVTGWSATYKGKVMSDQDPGFTDPPTGFL